MPIIMCKQCAGGIEYSADDYSGDSYPDVHSDVDKACKRPYRE